MSLYACFFLLLYGECEEDSWSCETAPCQMAPGDNKHRSALGCGKADILSTFARPHSISHIKDEFLFWILMGFYICYFFFCMSPVSYCYYLEKNYSHQIFGEVVVPF